MFVQDVFNTLGSEVEFAMRPTPLPPTRPSPLMDPSVAFQCLAWCRPPHLDRNIKGWGRVSLEELSPLSLSLAFQGPPALLLCGCKIKATFFFFFPHLKLSDRYRWTIVDRHHIWDLLPEEVFFFFFWGSVALLGLLRNSTLNTQPVQQMGCTRSEALGLIHNGH